MIKAHLVWALLILFLYKSHAFAFFLLRKEAKTIRKRLECYFRCWEHPYSFHSSELKCFSSAYRPALSLIFHTKLGYWKYLDSDFVSKKWKKKMAKLDKNHTEITAQRSILLAVITLTFISIARVYSPLNMCISFSPP